jgi:zinc transport system substrate-binding protein
MNRRQKLFLMTLIVGSSLVVSGLALVALIDTSEEDHRLRVVATFYPLAYLTEEIGGDRISLKTLIPQNTEVHAWEPSTSDILDVDQAAVVVYHGAGLDPWFEDEILPAIRTDDKLVVETTLGSDLIPAGNGYDPHTWLSPRMALPQAGRIHDAFCTADPLNASFFDDRYRSLKDRLESLDGEYVQLLSNKTKSAIFVGHSAYGYLAEAYGFEQHGIVGLSADESPSTTTIASLVELMVEYDIYYVFVDPLYRDDYAITLRDSLEEQSDRTVDVLPLYLLVGEVDGLDYIDQMEENLHNLAVGLEVTGAS